jgi:serine/threonine-protein kinase RsbW
VTALLDVPVLDHPEFHLDAPPPNRVTRRLLRDNLAPHAARKFATGILAAWNIHADTADTAELLVSELVTNAARHANRGRHITVTIERGDKTLRFTVTDTGRRRAPTAPIDPYGDGDDNGGWGLTLVDVLALDHGVYRLRGGNGNQVWFTLAAIPAGGAS